MRALGIDFGERRIGLAVADLDTRLAFALTTLERTTDRRAVAQIADLARAEGVAMLVLGEPRNLDGSAHERGERIRRFGAKLERSTGLPLRLAEETLTSVAAEERLREAGVDTRKDRQRIDAVAAQILLEQALLSPTTGAAS